MNRHPASSRVNPRVFQILAISVVALALPLALVGLGVREYLQKPKASNVPDAPGLRAALEQAAGKTFPANQDIPDARSVFIQSEGSPNQQQQIGTLEKLAAGLGGSTLQLSPGPDGGARILIQMPVEKAAAFESSALQGFKASQKGHPTGDTQIFEIQFPKS